MPARASFSTLLRRQQQLITRVQSLDAGVSRSDIDGHLRVGRWRRVLPQVYLVGPASIDPRLMIRAAWMWGGPDAVIVGQSALYWQRRHSGGPPDVIDVALPVGRSGRGPAGVKVQRRSVEPEQIVSWDRIATVRTAYAIAELLGVVGHEILDHAIRQRWVTLAEVQAAHSQLVGARHSIAARQIIDAATSGAHSPGERLLHRLLREAGISGWRANVDTKVGNSRRRPDVRFEKLRLVIEFDGFAFHTDHAAFEDDRRRQNAFVKNGWTVLRFTWSQLTRNPDEAIADIRATIGMLEASVQSAGRISC